MEGRFLSLLRRLFPGCCAIDRLVPTLQGGRGRRVNLVAVHGSVEGENSIMRLITTDNLRVSDALRGL